MKSLCDFWETILEREGLSLRRHHREFLLSPESLERFPERKRQRRRDIHLPLHLLSSRQREVIFALFYDSLTEEETARMLSISRRSVRIHRKRALEKLRKVLEESPLRKP
ncbi:MAG: RNA polymerase sigma factor [Candidatus Caldatribacteriaceae bacterium]